MSDLTPQEQTNARTALRYLKARCGGWAPLVHALRYKQMTMANALVGRPMTVAMVFRMARFAGVAVDDLLAGNFPPAGTCPYCGHQKTEGDVATQ